MDDIEVIRFRYDNEYGGYRCDQPGDRDGFYVPLTEFVRAIGLLSEERDKAVEELNRLKAYPMQEFRIVKTT